MQTLRENPEVFRYLLAGSTAFATEYLSFLVLFSVIGVRLYVANSVSFCAGLTVSFLLNRSWTFRSDNYHKKTHHQFALYAALGGFNLLLTNLVIGTLVRAGFKPLIGKVMTMALIVVWNFFIFKLVIFKTVKASND